MTDTLFTNTLPTNTAQLTDRLQQVKPAILNAFYLSGGTALSLQLGHRESEDLDFFSQTVFDPRKIEQELLTFGKLDQTELAEGTLNTYIDGVKLQFLHYPYDLLEPNVDWQGIKLSSVIDIACTKLQTISMRGSKKDFVDLYFLLEKYSLTDLFQKLHQKYQQSDYSQTHILKSLVYFDDAEGQPMPKMHKDITWDEVKQKMIDVTRDFHFDAS